LIQRRVIRLNPNFVVWQSAAYAVVDCVYSAQANYSGGVLPMLRVRLARRLPDDPNLALSAFIADVDGFGPDKFERYARDVLTRQVLARRRKVEICYDVARFLVQRRCEYKRDFQVLDGQTLDGLILGELPNAIRGIGPTLARYLLMLLGREDHIKPDIMMTRFFAGLSTWIPRYGHQGDAETMRTVIREVAGGMGTSAARLDNAIWLHQRAQKRRGA